MRRFLIFLTVMGAMLASASASAELDYGQRDPVVGCWPSEEGPEGDWTLAGPPFRVQGPLQVPSELWMRPRRTCGPTQLSPGYSPKLNDTGQHVIDFALDARIASMLHFFALLQATHTFADNWFFSSTPFGVAFIPPIGGFEQIFAFELRGLAPTGSHPPYRRWGIGVAGSATLLLLSWVDAHAWLGVDYQNPEIVDGGTTVKAVVGTQIYPRGWVSFVLDLQGTVGYATQFQPAAGLRFALPFASLEFGSALRIEADNDATPELWSRLSLHF